MRRTSRPGRARPAGSGAGKVRSTPTPYDTRRTVKVARAPSPRFRMMVPSKIWMRSFSPSMTFTWTRTLSPGTKAPDPA